VIVLGETGSGKEVVARAIHQASLLSSQPFLAVDCTIPGPLLEGELFGHERGAFAEAYCPDPLFSSRAEYLFRSLMSFAADSGTRRL
jgi:transcriptional regulator of aromatic amino acid metabolism